MPHPRFPMAMAFSGGSSLLKGCTRAVLCQTRGVKAYRFANRENWKPIPPKHRRDYYFMEREPFRWEKPLLDYREKLAKQSQASVNEPQPIHVVTRCKSLRGQTKVSKALCEHFGIKDKMHNPVLIANTPYNNEMLMQIKHIIRVKPLTTPDGLPENQAEMSHTQLRTDGSLTVIKTLPAFADKSTGDGEEKRTRLMTGETIKAKNARRVANHQILQEYCKTKYTFRYNEDGKEFPYRPGIGN